MGIRITDDSLPKPPFVPKPPKPKGLRGKASRRVALVPAGARVEAPTAPRVSANPDLTPLERALSESAIDTFVTAVGGRAKLLEVLAVGESDSAADQVVDLLLDDTYRHWSLRRICTHANITVAHLFASYKKAMFTRAHLQAAHTITERLPPIVEDVMLRATPQLIVCPACDGKPHGAGEAACQVCQGAGTVLSEPELDRQKLALELAKLTSQPRAGVLVQQNNQAAPAPVAAAVSGSLEQLQQAVGDLLFHPGRRRAASPPVVEAIVVNPSASEETPAL